MHHNVIAGFQNYGVSGFYILAMILLCMHLYHGLWSMFQSLGINHPRYTPLLKKGAAIVAILIAIGNISIPDRGDGRLLTSTEERQHGTRFEIPDGPDRNALGPPPFQPQAGESGEQAQAHDHRGGHRPGGGAAAATLAELGYNVKCFCFQDSPRRAHSIAAQGGINAAKNYHNDGDSVYRLFYDTVKGGDFRSRESNVYRLAQISLNIIDQCVAQGVPFAREYSGYLDNRSFGGAQVSRTFYARGQTGQQLLLGAYQALERQIGAGTVTDVSRAPRCST